MPPKYQLKPAELYYPEFVELLVRLAMVVRPTHAFAAIETTPQKVRCLITLGLEAVSKDFAPVFILTDVVGDLSVRGCTGGELPACVSDG